MHPLRLDEWWRQISPQLHIKGWLCPQSSTELLCALNRSVWSEEQAFRKTVFSQLQQLAVVETSHGMCKPTECFLPPSEESHILNYLPQLSVIRDSIVSDTSRDFLLQLGVQAVPGPDVILAHRHQIPMSDTEFVQYLCYQPVLSSAEWMRVKEALQLEGRFLASDELRSLDLPCVTWHGHEPPTQQEVSALLQVGVHMKPPLEEVLHRTHD